MKLQYSDDVIVCREGAKWWIINKNIHSQYFTSLEKLSDNYMISIDIVYKLFEEHIKNCIEML